jgi:hypothetical protein
MKSVSCVRAAVLAAAASLWASPVLAQVASEDQLSAEQRSELYCVHDELARDDDALFAVAEAVIFEDPTEDAETALAKANETCRARYAWEDDKRSLALEIGVGTAILEYFVEELYSDGVKEEHIPAIERALAKLSEKELQRFFDDDVNDDEAFADHLDALLVAEKFPGDDPYVLEAARFVMQTVVLREGSLRAWMDAYIKRKS